MQAFTDLYLFIVQHAGLIQLFKLALLDHEFLIDRSFRCSIML
ncbi:MAG: hypothetical protein K0S24_2615 [Sphingobacterium sp.]|jgi:hypothetical protein|nr:hypothetical protein [Sphingobacterium sp.]